VVGRGTPYRRLQDRTSSGVYDVYERNSDNMLLSVLYLDLPSWGYHVFEVTGIA